MEKKEKKCPKCGATTKQRKMGFTRSGTQRYICGHCKKTYTPEAKRREYPEEIRKQAIKMYYSGVSANQVGKMFHMNKGNGKSERSAAKDQFPRDHHRKFRGLFGRFHLFKDVQKSVRHLPDRRTEKYPERIIFLRTDKMYTDAAMQKRANSDGNVRICPFNIPCRKRLIPLFINL